VLDFEKQYRTARKLVGAEYRELVHMTFEAVHDKLQGVRYKDTYFTRCMMLMTKSGGKFTKQKRTFAHDQIDAENTEAKESDHSPYFEYCPEKVNDILLSLEKEGHKEEVQVFRLYLSGCNITQMHKITKVRRKELGECVKFVRETVRERYESRNH